MEAVTGSEVVVEIRLRDWLAVQRLDLSVCWGHGNKYTSPKHWRGPSAWTQEDKGNCLPMLAVKHSSLRVCDMLSAFTYPLLQRCELGQDSLLPLPLPFPLPPPLEGANWGFPAAGSFQLWPLIFWITNFQWSEDLSMKFFFFPLELSNMKNKI